MIRKTTTTLFTLFFLCVACFPSEVSEIRSEADAAVVSPVEVPVVARPAEDLTPVFQGPIQEEYQAPPYLCETFRVETQRARVDGKGLQKRFRHRRNRYAWGKKDRVRTRNLVRTVAREMGADPDYIGKIVLHESTWNPYAIHILNPDLESNKQAEQNLLYNDAVARDIQWKLTQPDVKGKASLRQRLALMSRYRGNPHLTDRIQFETDMKVDLSANLKTPKKGDKARTVQHTRSVWAYGYGLAGMNPTLFLHYWDSKAAPWVLCQDQGVVATVVLIWALRKQQSDCLAVAKRDPETYGEQGTIRTMTHRYARGRCEKSPRLKRSWRTLFEGMDMDSKVRLGRKWGQDSDREELLTHLRQVLREKGYYGEEFLPKRPAGAEPKIVAY